MLVTIMPTAQLMTRRWFRRTWLVTCEPGGNVHEIRYNGWGLNTEYVYLNGFEAVRRGASSLRLRSMTHGYRFALDDGHTAALSVSIPWWGEFFPVCDLSFVRLEIDGEVLYQEGVPPTCQMRWSTAAEGFPVIPLSPTGAPGYSPHQ